MAPSASSSSFSTEKSSPPLPHPFLLSAGRCIQSVTANILSHLPFPPPSVLPTHRPLIPPPAVTVPFVLPLPSSSSPSSSYNEDASSTSASPVIRGLSSSSSRARLDGATSASTSKGAGGGAGGGPAFVGQVFSMLDPSGNGLMTVTSNLEIPFLSKRTPEWIKKMFAIVTKKEQNGPVFRFFMDLSDAVAYVKRLNIPTGMVGACRLDVAFQHFKEEPHMFQFVPNEKQVKAANRLLKEIPTRGTRKKVDGVPVFTAQNLNIAIATNDGIKWYTPYFFDKNLLDNILEASVDQHFHTLIQNRHSQRRRDVIDDGMTAEVVEETADSMFEPPEVQEVLDELGHSGIPLSVISKAAEIQLLDVVDKVLLGNKWLRRATGIQPKFPYLVDSFEKRSTAAIPKAATLTSSLANSEDSNLVESDPQPSASALGLNESVHAGQDQSTNHAAYQFPFGDWLSNPWSKLHEKENRSRISGSDEVENKKVAANPLLPKITMVGISTGAAGQVSKANLKKTMEELTKELEQSSQKSLKSNEETDPLFVANVGDYSSITRMNST